MDDELTTRIYRAFDDICEAEGIAHPAGLREVLPHLYAAHTHILRARNAIDSVNRKRLLKDAKRVSLT